MLEGYIADGICVRDIPISCAISIAFPVQVLTKLGVQEFLPSDDALTAFEGNLCRQVPAATVTLDDFLCIVAVY